MILVGAGVKCSFDRAIQLYSNSISTTERLFMFPLMKSDAFSSDAPFPNLKEVRPLLTKMRSVQKFEIPS